MCIDYNVENMFLLVRWRVKNRPCEIAEFIDTKNDQEITISCLAQLVERETVNLEAVGSIPTARVFGFFCFGASPRFASLAMYLPILNLDCGLDSLMPCRRGVGYVYCYRFNCRIARR